MLKLYIYDHCPYCVKARMIFGFKNIKFDLITLANDDEKTPTSMIGSKMLPILETKDSKFMPESLDIISHVDQMHSPSLVSWNEDSGLSKWFGKLGSLHYELAMPRWAEAPLDEFKTQSSRAYFKNRLEKKLGSFSELMKQTSDLKQEMEQHLLKLNNLIDSKNDYFKKTLSENDFHLFAILRSLSIVRDLKFPKEVDDYKNKISEKSGVPLHHSIAI